MRIIKGRRIKIGRKSYRIKRRRVIRRRSKNFKGLLIAFPYLSYKIIFFYELSLWSNLAATVFLRTYNLFIFCNVPVTVDLKVVDLSRILLRWANIKKWGRDSGGQFHTNHCNIISCRNILCSLPRSQMPYTQKKTKTIYLLEPNHIKQCLDPRIDQI